MTDETVASYSKETIPSETGFLVTTGFATVGDGGGGAYRRCLVAPSHMASFRTKDQLTSAGVTDPTNGGYWELVDSRVDPRQLGAVADLTSFWDASITNGSATVTFQNTTFTAADQGKIIGFYFAGGPTAAINYLTVQAVPAQGDSISIGGTNTGGFTAGGGTFNGVVTGVNGAATGFATGKFGAVGSTASATNIPLAPSGTTASLATVAAAIVAWANSVAATTGFSATIDAGGYNWVQFTATTLGPTGNGVQFNQTTTITAHGPRLWIWSPVSYGALANGTLATTIKTVNGLSKTVTSSSSITLATPVLGATRTYSSAQNGAGGVYGTDNTAALQNAINFCSTSDGWSPGVNLPAFTKDGDMQAAGGRALVLSGKGTPAPAESGAINRQCRYGVASTLTTLSRLHMYWEGDASLGALPGFNGTALLAGPTALLTGSTAPTYSHSFFDSPILEGNGFVENGIHFRVTNNNIISGRAQLYDFNRAGIRCGYIGVQVYDIRINTIDHRVSDRPYDPAGLITGGFNDPTSCAIQWDYNATDSRVTLLISNGSRWGFIDNGAENHCLDGHTYGGIGASFFLNGSTSQHGNLYSDTPNSGLINSASNPGAQTTSGTAFGALSFQKCRVQNLHVYINGSKITNVVGFYNWYQGQNGAYTSRVELGSLRIEANASNQFQKIADGYNANARASLSILQLTQQSSSVVAAVGVPPYDEFFQKQATQAEFNASAYLGGFTTGQYSKFGARVTARSMVKVVRAVPSYALNAAGTAWTLFNTNEPRITDAGLYVEPVGATNYLPNSDPTFGSAGSLPSGWTFSNYGGRHTCTVNSSGVNDAYGLPYIDVTFASTVGAASGDYPGLVFQPSEAINAANNDIWLGSLYAKNSGGTPFTGINYYLVVYEFGLSGNNINQATATLSALSSTTPTLMKVAKTMDNSAHYVGMGWTYGGFTAGQTYSFSVRLYGLMLEKTNSPTPSTPIVSSTGPTSRTETATLTIPPGSYDICTTIGGVDSWNTAGAPVTVATTGYPLSPTVATFYQRVLTAPASVSDAEQTWRSSEYRAYPRQDTMPGVAPTWGPVTGGPVTAGKTPCSTTAVAGDKLLVDTSNGPLTVFLPAGANEGDEVSILDETGNFSTNNACTVTTADSINIRTSSSLSMSTQWQGLTFVKGKSVWTYK